MEEAKSRTTGSVWDADEFAALSLADRDAIRETLTCTACGADAYFIREARNGRRACFGARPHLDDCELASFATHDGGAAPLDEVDELINAGDIFRIDPNRGRTIRHVRHDPSASPASGGSAVRYTRRGRGLVRQSSMGLGRLLRQLVMREAFRRSQTLLIMSDDSRQTVKSGCVHLTEIEDKHNNRLRVFWGTIRFPRSKEGGGAWLNTGWGSPTIVIDEHDLATLLERSGLEELDELSGSFFAVMGRLRDTSNGKRYLFINEDVYWMAVRPFSDDENLN